MLTARGFCVSKLLRAMRLPKALDDMELYVDFLAVQVAALYRYNLVGDSFGAKLAIAL